jgi:hypothetical protein
MGGWNKTQRIFHFVMIRPTHYDDDGYPIQWFLSLIPSNTLACMNGLAEDCRRRAVLGSDVDLRLHTFDETNQRVRPDRIIRAIQRNGNSGLIGLVGVQSNQIVRALDLALPFRRADLPVCIGGFHVSGCLAMLPNLPEELQRAQAMGVSLFAGEAEESRLDLVLKDAYLNRLKPLYNFMRSLPSLSCQPAPILPRKHVRRTYRGVGSIDLGRGCPFQCSFCTIINVQGRKSRFRTPDDLEKIIRLNSAQGIHRFFITDDNFARNRNWEAFLDLLIRLREEQGFPIELTIQVDALCHRIPNFVEKAVRAGVHNVFFGLENINPESLRGAKKKQNRVAEYRVLLQAWKSRGVKTYAGYILGFPTDTRERILADVETIKSELPVDLLEFFFLTPLPGSEHHQALAQANVWMDPDMNKYDLSHRVSHHQRMTDEEWETVYREAWQAFYTPQHMKTILRRTAAYGGDLYEMSLLLGWFLLSIRFEGVHPLESGLWRMKFRADRRFGMPLEGPLQFYSNYMARSVWNLLYRLGWVLRLTWMRWCVEFDWKKNGYRDVSLSPEVDLEQLDLTSLARGEKVL